MRLGDPGWKADIDQGVAIVRSFHPTMRALTLLYKYGLVPGGALLPDAVARRETAELLESAEQSGDNLTMAAARWVRGLVLVGAESLEREQGFELLAQAREAALAERFTMAAVPVIDMELAKEKARTGDLDDAIELARAVVDDEFETGEMTFRGPATTVLVESLLRRGTDADVQEANGAVERLASVPTDPGFVLHDIWLLRLRALLAQAQEDDAAIATIGIATAPWRHRWASRGISCGPRRCHDGGWVGVRASFAGCCLSQSRPGEGSWRTRRRCLLPPCSTNWRTSIPRSGGKWPLSFAVCPRPWPRCLTARRPPTCSACWLTCSIRPDQRVDLYRIRSVPGQASVPSTQLCFPTTCRPESMSR